MLQALNERIRAIELEEKNKMDISTYFDEDSPRVLALKQQQKQKGPNKKKKGKGKAEAELRAQYQVRLEEALERMEKEKRDAVEEAYKEAFAQAEAEKSRALQEAQETLDENKKSFVETMQAEMAQRLNEANATAEGALKDDMYEEYEKKLAEMTVKTKQHFKEKTERELTKQREEFQVELDEARAKANAESIETVRAELEAKLQAAQAAAENEREQAVATAQEASIQKMQAEKEEAVKSVMAASEAERMKAVEDALSRAEEDRLTQIKQVLEQAEAAKVAAIQNMEAKMEREKSEAIDKMAGDHESAIKAVKEENLAKLTELLSQMEEQEMNFQSELDEAIVATRNEMEDARTAAVEEANAVASKKIEQAEQDRESFKTLYHQESQSRKALHNRLVELQGNIRVFCRVRPVVQQETEAGADDTVVEFPGDEALRLAVPTAPSAVKSSSRKLGAEDGGKTRRTVSSFEFDRTFGPDSTQAQVFEAVQPLVISVLDGYNVCIFAYGQTGSGKTHTMEGPDADPGVNRRAITELFAQIEERSSMFDFELEMSMLEIYNEEIKDLLDPSDKKLEIRKSKDGNGHDIPELRKEAVSSAQEVQAFIATGSNNRTVGRHNMNEHSSRSHLVLTFYARSIAKQDGATSRAKLHMIDLAGSERVSKTDATGTRLKEAQNINKSLSALGDVIAATGKKASHVPFRNSKLTFLLQDALTNGSKMQMFVNCSPALYNAPETLCSLNFAKRCRSVELGAAKKNSDSAEVMRLRKIIKQLREDLEAIAGADDDESVDGEGAAAETDSPTSSGRGPSSRNFSSVRSPKASAGAGSGLRSRSKSPAAAPARTRTRSGDVKAPASSMRLSDKAKKALDEDE